MAEKKKRKSSRRPRQRSLTDLFRRHKRQKANEFKPDAPTATLFKTRKLTQQQQLRLTKWVLYVVIIVLCLVIQDTVMCRLPLLGATTDLPVAAILLITVTEGTDVGSLFILIASVLYYFSGTAPGPYCIGLMSVFGIFATMVRQMYWHRSRGSLTISAMLALVCYELGLFVTGLLKIGRAHV